MNNHHLKRKEDEDVEMTQPKWLNIEEEMALGNPTCHADTTSPLIEKFVRRYNSGWYYLEPPSGVKYFGPFCTEEEAKQGLFRYIGTDLDIN